MTRPSTQDMKRLRLAHHTRLENALRQLHPMVPMFALKRLNRIEKANRARARRKGCDFEPFDFVKVCQEQDWICAICGEPMDWYAHGDEPMSISLDHVTGLAQGGAHNRKNAAATHKQCNIEKARIFDAPNAAKCKRMAGETGQYARRKKNGSKMKSRSLPGAKSKYKRTVGGKTVLRA